MRNIIFLDAKQFHHELDCKLAISNIFYPGSVLNPLIVFK